ncbi:MAG: hypothetical protein JWL61_3729 [Gemmatimonadetes bacterium]|nr:hypothetical protein [Gemmatimonadota bacterium]
MIVGTKTGVLAIAALCGFGAVSLRAQRIDSTRVTPMLPVLDTAITNIKPPLSPRRAFLYSLAAPGLGQSRLGRPVAGAIFVFTESIAIAMLRESMAELRQARSFRTDSLVQIGNDPVSGLPITHRSSYTDELINVRKSHVEDWIAFLIANHLFAGADSYVAAHLWDLPAQIKVTQQPNGTSVIAARFSW